MSGRIGLTVADGVARILIDRPDKMNAILPEMVLELQRVCQAVNDDANVRVATIMGAGERAFSAGSDLRRRQSSVGTPRTAIFSTSID